LGRECALPLRSGMETGTVDAPNPGLQQMEKLLFLD